MHPAFSVIFLTTLIGAGQGLFVALYLAELGARYGWISPVPGGFYAAGSALVIALMVLGLIASIFHLGRPERGWRAAARWRTSWLSREIIVLPLFTAGAFFYGAAHWLLPPDAGARTTLALGAVTVVLSFALYVCTGMIYACLKFLQEWATPLTVVNYTLLGLASGFTAATAYAAFAAPPLAGFFGQGALVLAGAALLTRGASLVRNARLKPKSTLATAIGIKHQKIVQKSMGMMGGAFNTREFFHGRTRATLRAVKWLFLLLVFPVPAALLAAGLAQASAPLLAAAFALQYLGLLAERWFFFAQANHPQNLYYQSMA
ncbi:MAG: DmsC/YnfH family molybdoenzyme membrane anchor subunit [Pseudomonadota bacterium]